jgi:hypothetical protein
VCFLFSTKTRIIKEKTSRQFGRKAVLYNTNTETQTYTKIASNYRYRRMVHCDASCAFSTNISDLRYNQHPHMQHLHARTCRVPPQAYTSRAANAMVCSDLKKHSAATKLKLPTVTLTPFTPSPVLALASSLISLLVLQP